MRGIHRWPVSSLHRGPVTRKKASIWWRHHDHTKPVPYGWHSDWRISPGTSQSQQREDKIMSFIHNFSWCRVECFTCRHRRHCQGVRELSISNGETGDKQLVEQRYICLNKHSRLYNSRSTSDIIESVWRILMTWRRFCSKNYIHTRFISP